MTAIAFVPAVFTGASVLTTSPINFDRDAHLAAVAFTLIGPGASLLTAAALVLVAVM